MNFNFSNLSLTLSREQIKIGQILGKLKVKVISNTNCSPTSLIFLKETFFSKQFKLFSTLKIYLEI
jgi:hypothetical protein